MVIYLLALATLVYAFAGYFEVWYFYGISVAARLIQGAAHAIALITIPSIITVQYPEKIEVYQGFVNMASGVGLTIGALLASVLANYFEYITIEFIFAGLLTGLSWAPRAAAACPP